MAILSKELVLERFQRTEDRRKDYLQLAEQWEKMWRLDAGFRQAPASDILEGREQVTLPTPFNVVNLSQRLLSTIPKINVIPQEVGDQQSVEYAEQCEKWLQAMWKRVNRDQKRNILADIIWYALVRGRFAVEVKWVKENLPTLRRKTMLPFTVRALDPINVGSWAGPTYVEWVYHTYDAPLLEVLHKWPELKGVREGALGDAIVAYDKKTGEGEDVEVRVVDFWYVAEDDGSIWNCILVEDEFAKRPQQTDYPDLPIIVGRGDYGVNLGDEWDGLSILHPINGLWQYQCRLASQMATGLLWHFWPAILVTNDNNAPVDDIEVGPGITTPAPPGTKVDMVRIDPNVPLAQAVYGQIEGFIQQATYPEVMYGKAPGDLQAGYGVSLLTDAARGRIKNYAEALEMVLSHVHYMALSLVETFQPSGVTIAGYDDTNRQAYSLKLTAEMVRGYYDNEVKVTPNLPSDQQARVMTGMRLADSKHISEQTFLDLFVDVPVPTDERTRITYEELMNSDELRPWRLRKAAEKAHGPAALTLLYNTSLMPPPPPGFHWIQKELDGPVTLEPDNPPPGPGPMGPMGPEGMPMQPPGPPGPGQMPMQPPAIPTATGTAMPPDMSAQFMPSDVNLPPGPGGNPIAFADLMNNPLSQAEVANILQGLPQQGPLTGGMSGNV